MSTTGSEVTTNEPIETSSDSDDDDTIDEADGDDDLHWPFGLNSLNSFNLPLAESDRAKFKEDLATNLRIGSSYYIGTYKRKVAPDRHKKANNHQRSSCTVLSSSCAFLRHPLNLVLAREQGDIGPSHKLTRRFRYQASRWRVDRALTRHVGLQVCGSKSFEPMHSDPQTFQELIQGSLWSVSRLHLEDRFRCHNGCVNALHFNSTGNWIASGSDDLQVVVTDWTTKEQVTQFDTGHTQNIFHVKFIPQTNDTQIVSCSCDSEVRLAHLASDGSLVGGSTRLLVSHNEACHKLAIPTTEPTTVLSAGADGRVYSIDLRAPEAHCILHLPRSEFFSISTNPVKSNEIALCGKSEAIVRVYDRRNMSSINPRKGYLRCFGADSVISRHRKPSDSTRLQATQAHRRDLAPRRRRRCPPANSADQIEHPDSSDSSSSASDLDDASNSFFHSYSVQLGRQFRDDGRLFRDRLRLLRDGDREEGGEDSDSDRNVAELDIDGTTFQKSDYCVTSAMYSAQGDVLLASYNDDDIYLFDVKQPSHRYIHKYTGHRNMPTIVSATFFGPNSEYVISGSDDGFFYIWDRESEGIVQWLHADAEGAVNVVESHPTLPVLASAGLDHDFKVWTPNRPLARESYYNYRYTSGPVPPDITVLRNSRLDRMLFSQSPASEGTITASQIHANVNGQGDQLSVQTQIASPSQVSQSETVTLQNSSCSRKRPHHSRTPSPSMSCVPLEDGGSPGSSSSPCNTLSATKPTTTLTSSDDSGTVSLSKRHNYSQQQSQEQQVPSSTNEDDRGVSGDIMDPANNDQGDSAYVTTSSSTVPVDEVTTTSTVPQKRPPQSLLPFNCRDVELRVAQNWCNRIYERSYLESVDARILSVIESVAEVNPRYRGAAIVAAVLAGSSARDGDAAEAINSSRSSDDEALASNSRSRGYHRLTDDDVDTDSSQTTISSLSSFLESYVPRRSSSSGLTATGPRTELSSSSSSSTSSSTSDVLEMSTFISSAASHNSDGTLQDGSL